jgi:hypothetical protein
MSIKVGVQGRILLGPLGTPGSVDIPLRYAVVREGPEPRLVCTKFKRIGATISQGQTNLQFVDVEAGLSFPLPSSAELAAYVVYVGFDEVGDSNEKRPPNVRTTCLKLNPPLKIKKNKPIQWGLDATETVTSALAFGLLHPSQPTFAVPACRLATPINRNAGSTSFTIMRCRRTRVRSSGSSGSIIPHDSSLVFRTDSSLEVLALIF